VEDDVWEGSREGKIEVLKDECCPYCIVEYGLLSDTDPLFISSIFVLFGIVFTVQFS